MEDETIDKYVGVNIDKPIIEVKQSDLKPLSGSRFSSQCPSCPEGVLLVRRDQKTLKIVDRDFCCLCGQPVKYLDLADLQKMDKVNDARRFTGR